MPPTDPWRGAPAPPPTYVEPPVRAVAMVRLAELPGLLAANVVAGAQCWALGDWAGDSS